MRSFIRHPTDIPIEVRHEDQSCRQDSLRNVSRGGLCFLHSQAAPVGSDIVVRIVLTSPPFEVSCHVTWCPADGSAWQVGVGLLDQSMLFRLRMVEQICHIEYYRCTLRESQGRALSSQEGVALVVCAYTTAKCCSTTRDSGSSGMRMTRAIILCRSAGLKAIRTADSLAVDAARRSSEHSRLGRAPTPCQTPPRITKWRTA